MLFLLFAELYAETEVYASNRKIKFEMEKKVAAVAENLAGYTAYANGWNMT